MVLLAAATFLALAANPAAASAGDPRVGGIQATALDRRPELLQDLVLPPDSRDDSIQDPVLVPGPWRLVSTVRGVRTWEARLPVRPRTLFFHRPPDGMALKRRAPDQPWDQAETWQHRRGLDDAHRAGTWEFTTHALRVRRKAEVGPPEPGEYAVVYPTAVQRESDFQRRLTDGDDQDFVFRSAQLDDTTRHGLFLPAPASASFTVDIPEGGVLDLDAGLLPPEAARAGHVSDGAILRVSLNDQLLAEEPLAVEQFRSLRVPLPQAGSGIIRLEVDPGGSADLDYAFLATPVVHRPMADPPRVVLFFVDTLRRDALSMYGYDRPTSPKLDAWAADGTVFTNARSVAPWTLPSSRTMFLGTQPERWGQVETLQERAARAGWATAFVSGNVYLSSNFGMERGWGTHRCVNWPSADVQVDRSLAWLDAHRDRPALLVVHLMDMHLPYTEPAAYRDLFAGKRPDAFDSDDFLRADVRRATSSMGEEGKAWVRGRYDNNLRLVDDQLARVLAALGPDDTVVLLSDHGEEFWDHGGFEHGHTLYDELLAVPLAIVGPGLPASRIDAPVSLLDVAPTLASTMGLSTADMTGVALQAVANGGGPDLADRAIGFGRPLYGLRQWGVVAGDWKYTAEDGDEHLFDLARDPGEQHDKGRTERARVPELRESLGVAVGRPAVSALRFEPGRTSSKDALEVLVHIPGGVAHAWAAEDPLNQADIEVQRVDAENVRLTWKAGARGVREAYVLPEDDMQAALPQVQLTLRSGRDEDTANPAWGGGPPPAESGKAHVLFRGRAGSRSIAVDRAVVPLPAQDAIALSGVDSELQGDLEALGYVDD